MNQKTTLKEAAAALGAVAIRNMEEAERTAAGLPPGALNDARDTLEKTGVIATKTEEGWSEDPEGNPLLIEGTLYYREVKVTLPDGKSATFRLASAGMGAGLKVLVHIYPAASRFANVFRYSPEGTHQFIGRAARMEQGGEA